MARLDLSGAWEILPVAQFDGRFDDRRWLSAPVPGHFQQVPGLEGYTGKVVYRRSFEAAPRPGRRHFLRLNGAFYWSTAYLNGARLGANEGYFFPVEYEVTGLLRESNEVLVELDCPEEKNKEDKRQITGVFHHWDSIDPALNPGGLWLPVELIETGPVRAGDVQLETLYLARDGRAARIATTVQLDAASPMEVDLRFSFIPRTFEGETIVFDRRVSTTGRHSFHQEYTLPDPRLWWTWDHGRPDLYTVRVEARVPGEAEPSDACEAPFGVRTLEMHDSICRLNGRRVYLRGNNYPPGDARLASVTRASADRDLALAREANLNILRVHAHVDHPAFYDACDAAGMLLWQDFPLQWRYNPDAVTDLALRQVGKMIGLLGNHPSIAVWCVHNEPLRMYDSRKIPGPLRLLRFAFSALVWNCNRDRMDLKLAARSRRLDPRRFVSRASGERGLGRRPGDLHSYFGWYFGPLRWFHRTYVKHPDHLRLVTEFGAQSLPNLESSVRFMDPDLRKVDWKTLRSRHSAQPFFLNFVARPQDFPDLAAYIAATQAHQAEVNDFYIDRIRARKYKPGGGVVAFSFHDANPAVTWSVLDYWRVPKSSYHALARAMSPVAAFAIPERAGYRRGEVARIGIHAVNDTPEAAAVTVRARIISPVGETIVDETLAAELAADAPAVVLLNPEVRLRWEGEYRMEVDLEGPQGRLSRSCRIRVK